MPDLDHARLLLDIARRDLTTLSAMSESTLFPDEVFGFHAQQAVEKALKAWLAAIDVEYPRIHDLDELSSLLADNGQQVESEFRDLASLTPFAVQFRYDTLDSGMGGLDRSAITKSINRLIDHVTTLISC
jgi:HEPN domain-containing protein